MNRTEGNVHPSPRLKNRRRVGPLLAWSAERVGIKILAAVAAGGLLIAGAGVAYADDIYNNLDGTIDAVAEIMPLNVGGPNGATTLALRTADGDGKGGCNLTGQHTLTLSLASSNPAVATVSPSSVVFTGCGFTQVLTIAPVSAGTANVSASLVRNSTPYTFNLAPVTFTVNVVAPAPANTAPTLTIGGVSPAASYPKGSVPAAICNVADAEDGPKSFNATLSAVTGPYASDGIGTQTASCSYTDAGLLTASGSVTYSISDPSAPVISFTVSPGTPNGLSQWYTLPVNLHWTVTDLDSPNSVIKTGCEDQLIAADQVKTNYSCSAVGAGGTAAQQDVSIGLDGTAPTVAFTSVDRDPNVNGWYNSPVTVTFTGTDGISGPPSATKTATSSGEGAEVVVYSPSYTDEAGNVTAPGAAERSLAIDGTSPSVSYTSAVGTAGNDGWYRSPVTATFTGEDALSGPSSATQTAATLAGVEGADVLVGNPAFTDLAGNVTAAGTVTQGFKIDWTAPSVTYTGADRPPNGNGWYNDTVTATFTGTDEISGPSTATQTADSSGEGAAVVVSSPAFSDAAGNVRPAGSASGTYQIDKTPPAVSFAGAEGLEGDNGWYRGTVTATFAGEDALSGPASVTQTADSSGEGAAVVVSSPAFTDLAGNSSAVGAGSQSFKIDSTAPSVTYSGISGNMRDNGWYISPVTATFTGEDALSGPQSVTETVVSTTEGTGIVLTSPAFKDGAGNVTPAGEASSAAVKIDLGNPVATFDSYIPNFYYGHDVTAPTCTATDGVSGPRSCVVTGYSTVVGTHVLTATATDIAGRTSTEEQTYTVMAWTAKGFYQPIDMGGVLNMVKAGSTVPAKFELFAGTRELTDTSFVAMSATKITCTLAYMDDIELTATGNTSLRYDATGGQFIYNWKTPATPGACYQLTMTARDGSTLKANFKLK